MLSSTAFLPQADVRGQLLPQETSTCVWLLSISLVKRGIADNANSDEGNDRFCKWKGTLRLGNGQGGKKSHMAGSWLKMWDPFPIPLAGKWGPVKTLYSHIPLLHAYPPHLVPFLSYQSSPLPSSHTLPWYFTLHPHYPIFLVPFFLPTCMFWKPAVPHSGKARLPLQAEDGCDYPTWAAPLLPQTCPHSSQGTDSQHRSVLLQQKGSPRDSPRPWQQMPGLLGCNGLPGGCAPSRPAHRQFHWKGGQQPLRSPSFSDLQILEQNTDLCRCGESWWRCSDGPWNQCTFPVTRDMCSPSWCLHTHPLRVGTKGTSQREPSRAAWITWERAQKKKSGMASKGMLCASVCGSFAAYKKILLNQMLVSNGPKSS